MGKPGSDNPTKDPTVHRSLAPDTTAQQDMVTAGQRRVNMIWETTQASIAVVIVGAMVYCEVHGINSDKITNACFLIVGFYFSRTNHTATGGVGPKLKEQIYQGR
jgi:hypothetical protein